MPGPLAWHLLITALTLMVAVAALGFVWSIHPLINGTGALQAMIVCPTWVVNFLFISVLITNGTTNFNVTWFYGIPWPYVLGFTFLFVPGLNTVGVAGSVGVISIAIWLLKMFWIYS